MFAQSSKQTAQNGTDNKHFDKIYWKGKECYNCHKKGHPSCPYKEGEDDEDGAGSVATMKKLEKSQ